MKDLVAEQVSPHKAAIVGTAGIVLVLGILYWNAWTTPGTFLGDFHDTLLGTIPYLFYQSHPFSLWNNLWGSGFPVLPNPFSDRFYPLSQPFILLADNPAAVNFSFALHVIIAFWTMYLLAGLFCRDKTLSAAVGLSYALSGVLLFRIQAGHMFYLYALAWLPLLYYAFFRIFIKNETKIEFIALFSVAGLLIYLTGGQYYFVYALMVCALYFLYLVVTRSLSRNQWFSAALCALGVSTLTAFKLIPDFLINPWLVRIDPIDPLLGGGALEASFASLAAGIPFGTSYGFWESAALIGIIPLLLAVVGFLSGQRKFAIPAFISLVFACIWAGGGNTLFYPLHFLPFMESFRCPGRIIGAVVPVLLCLSACGLSAISEAGKNKKALVIGEKSRRLLVWAVLVLVVVKIAEMPLGGGIRISGVIIVAVLAGFLLLLLSGKGTFQTLCAYGALSLFITAVLIFGQFLPSAGDNLVRGVIAGVVLAAVLFYGWKIGSASSPDLAVRGLLVTGIILVLIGAALSVHPTSPDLGKSTAIEVTASLQQQPGLGPSVTVFETGWPFMNMDYTWWFTKSGIQSLRAYYPYFLNSSPAMVYTLGGAEYSYPDFIVGTFEGKNATLPTEQASFVVEGIPVIRPGPSVPFVFVLRGDLFVPSTILRMAPDKVTITGDFQPGDVAVLKYSYAPGWSANGEPAIPIGNLVSYPVRTPVREITFTYFPPGFAAGMITTLFGVALFIVLFSLQKRKERQSPAGAGTVPECQGEDNPGK